jgi:N-acetylmuramoyl-L-alanine amidase
VWRSRWVRALIALLAVGCAGAAIAAVREAPRAGVLKVRLGGDAQQTRVVIELDQAATARLVAGAEPSKQVLLALPHVSLAGEMAGQGAGLVRGWTMDDAAGAARLKLTLARAAAVKRRFLLPPGDGVTTYRYVIDLEGAEAAPAAPGLAAAEPDAAPIRIEAPIEPPTPARKVVVIDAGHGGKDPGAHGQEAHEKDITLAAAKALRDRLERTGRYQVVLTRDADVFVPLEDRVRIARRANADLFISLHADSGGDPSIRGASLYTLSEHGAARTAHGVFSKSNWFIDVDLPGRDPAVNRILLDLTQRETTNRSAAFAEAVLDKIADRTTLLRRSHRDAGFMVLLAPDVPAVLMEMGFLTNADDEDALRDPARRRRVMDGVAEAIDAYFGQEKRYALR